jgi:hypothetical protein
MKVICKENTAEHLDLNEVKGIPQNTVYALEKGKEYIVMGVMMPKDSNCLYYLVDEADSPYWMPYGLFDVSDNELSFNWAINNWSVRVFNKKTGLKDVLYKLFNKSFRLRDLFYLVGFDELCNDESYHDALMGRKQYALDIYFQRKAEIQELSQKKIEK